MAEETTILLDDGRESLSIATGPESEAQTTPDGTAAEDIEALRAERDRLKERSEQLLRERNGWQAETRRQMEQSREMTERLARLEGRLESGGQSQHTQPQAVRYTPGQLKVALRKWLDGDESDMDAVEAALAAQRVEPAQQPITPQQVQELVRTSLVELGTRGNVQNMVGRRHPDMANPQSPLSQRVWDTYDQYANDQETQLLFPKDQRFEVPMIGPDGSQRMVDGRVIDRMCAELRLSGAVEEGRREEQRAATRGGVTSGQGQRGNSRAVVEAIELVPPGVIDLLASREIQRGDPKIPRTTDRKVLAKYYYDTSTKEEQAKLLADYRARNSVVR